MDPESKRVHIIWQSNGSGLSRVVGVNIASDVAFHTTEVGSGRAGRTRLLSLEERTRLAVRAYTRHKYTDYEKQLEDLGIPLKWTASLYQEIRVEASESVDAFLSSHRKP